MEPTEQKTEHCLNCGTELQDRFCSHCGQDSKEFKRSVWQLFYQFFETFTDFDGKLWASLVPLVFKPGFLTRKYLEGKRKSYLNPIQMYAFFSFVFFLTVFYLPESHPETVTPRQALTNAVKKGDASALDDLEITIDSSAKRKEKKVKEEDDGDSTDAIHLNGLEKNVLAYDSVQNALPESKRDGPLKKTFKRKFLIIKERLENKDASLVDEFFDGFKANLPNLIILLLPMFALVSKLLYIRRKIYYVEHLIFAVHLHCFVFLLFSVWLLAELLVPPLEEYFFWTFPLLLVYAYLTMKNLFNQSWLRTFVKFNLLGMTYTLILVVGLVMNFLLSAFFLA